MGRDGTDEAAREPDDVERFYLATDVPVYERMQAEVLGASWGGNGYTTVAQADRMGELLELGPGRLLVDLGAGRGWPGLYLAATTGCEAVLVDLPLAALRQALARVRRERLEGRAVTAVGAAPAIPLRAGIADGVVHADVLC